MDPVLYKMIDYTWTRYSIKHIIGIAQTSRRRMDPVLYKIIDYTWTRYSTTYYRRRMDSVESTPRPLSSYSTAFQVQSIEIIPFHQNSLMTDDRQVTTVETYIGSDLHPHHTFQLYDDDESCRTSHRTSVSPIL